MGESRQTTVKTARATAQEPNKTANSSYGKTIKVATINVRGINKAGKREEIETWMKKNNVQIVALQETRIKTNSRESRKEFTWYFSGENGRDTYTPGVGFVINNTYIQHVRDIEPINDRIIVLSLRHTPDLTLISAYMPQAGRPSEEKETTYEQLNKEMQKKIGKGPTYVLGDMNARIQTKLGTAENGIVGKHTFSPETADPIGRSDNVIENRQLLINFCMRHKCQLANTFFKKRKEKLATYREIGVTRDQDIKRGTHEQIDYVIVPQRWKNNILNAEADEKTNIDTDHNPVMAEIRVRLKAIRATNKRRPKYQECTAEQRNTLNQAIQQVA